MAEKVRILHCVPGDMSPSGIQNFIMNMYRNIDRDIVQFDFIVHSKEENIHDKEIRNLGGKIYRVEYKTRNYKKYKEQMEKILKEHPEYKIIHIHAPYAIAITDVCIAKKYGLKVIIHAHSSDEIFKRKIIHIALKNKMSKMADYRFACSVKAAKWLFDKENFKKDKYTIINNSIQTKEFIYNPEVRSEVRNKLNLDNYFVIGNVSRLSYLKNIDFLIKIFNEINLKCKKSKLLLVGDGPEKSRMEKLVKQLKLEDSVVFLGNCNNVNEILNAMDVFVMPSRSEGFGISLLEAQAAGLKCFTSKNVVPEDIQIKNNQNILEFISLKNTPRQWANKILDWNNGYKRLDISDKIEKAGYDLEKSAEILQKKYIEIVGE